MKKFFYIRSILEVAVPVWYSSLTLINEMDIERVQKAILQREKIVPLIVQLVNLPI